MDRDPYAAPDCGPPPALRADAPAFTPLLVRAAIATLGGLLLGCLLVIGVAIVYLALSSPKGLLSLADRGPAVLEVVLFAILIGGMPALVIGTPGYALLVRWGWANALSVGVLGAAPGLALLLLGTQAGQVFAVFGLVVALMTHALYRLSPHLQRKGP